MKPIKGQIAIEYILFLAILLLFFQSVVYPNVNFSENIIKDVYGVTQTKQSLDQLGDSISSFSSTPGYGSRLVYVYLPEAATLTGCDTITKQINYEVSISEQKPKPNISSCNRITNICSFNIQLYIDTATISCDKIGPGYNGYLTIEKQANGDINVFRP